MANQDGIARVTSELVSSKLALESAHKEICEKEKEKRRRNIIIRILLQHLPSDLEVPEAACEMIDLEVPEINLPANAPAKDNVTGHSPVEEDAAVTEDTIPSPEHHALDGVGDTALVSQIGADWGDLHHANLGDLFGFGDFCEEALSGLYFR